jgi:hypothetical protein
MRKRRYEILLPLTHNDGRPVNPEKFEQTHEELIVQFGALTTVPQLVRGIWHHEGVRYEDQSWRITIDVAPTKKNRAFFQKLKATLMDRFEQIVIYIASYSVEIL